MNQPVKDDPMGCALLVGGLCIAIGIGALFGAAWGWLTIGGELLGLVVVSAI